MSLALKAAKRKTLLSAGTYTTALRVDPHIKNTCVFDVTGCSAVFYDTRVKLVKV
jgi:hypothetical protein